MAQLGALWRSARDTLSGEDAKPLRQREGRYLSSPGTSMSTSTTCRCWYVARLTLPERRPDECVRSSRRRAPGKVHHGDGPILHCASLPRVTRIASR